METFLPYKLSTWCWNETCVQYISMWEMSVSLIMCQIHGRETEPWYTYLSLAYTSRVSLAPQSALNFCHLSCLTTKPTTWSVRPAKTQISMGIRPVGSESSMSAWRNLGPSATHWAHCEDSDQTGRMPRLIWAFAGRKIILLVLTWGGSFQFCNFKSDTYTIICGVKIFSFTTNLFLFVFCDHLEHLWNHSESSDSMSVLESQKTMTKSS